MFNTRQVTCRKYTLPTSVRRLLPVLTCLALLFQWSCSTEEATNPSIRLESRFRTSSTEYFADLSAEEVKVSIPVRYTNLENHPAYISTCDDKKPDFSLESWNGERWSTAFGLFCHAITRRPIVVPAGQTYTTTLDVRGFTIPKVIPRFETRSLPGPYRVVFPIYSILNTSQGAPIVEGPLLPIALRVSNQFAILPRQSGAQ